MKKLHLLKTVLLLCALIVGSGTMWADEETTTYIFTNRDWNATCNDQSANWTCGLRGSGFTAGQGTQVATSANGANATSPVSFTDVKKIVVTYCTNNKAGNGTIKVKVGSGTEQSFTVTAPSSGGGTTLKSTEFSFEPTESGSVTLTVNCSKNSVYIYSIAITTEDNAGGAAATEDPTITFSDASVRVGQNLDLSTLFESNSEGAVTYSITEGDSYAFLNGTTLTGVAEGSVKVKAVQAAAGNYNAGEAIATITVNAALTLSSIAITTAPTKTTYTEGEMFDPTGMVVTATYSDSSTGDVTASCTFSPSTSTALTTSDTGITVSYTENNVEKTATQAITVNAIPSHNVTWSINGVTNIESYKEGAAIVFPANPGDVNVKTFVGWITEAIEGTTDDEPAFVNTATATMGESDVTYYAVFALASGSGPSNVIKSYGFETESDPDWTIDGPARTAGEGNTGSYAGKINSHDTYITFNDKVKVKEFSFAFKRTSTNSNYNVYIETSEDNSTWTAAETYAMSSFNNGSYSTTTKEFDGTQELYVRFHCYNTTAVRYVDDVTITYVGVGGISYSGYCTTVAAGVAVTGVSVDATASVKVGETTTLTATVSPDNATNKNVTWTSSDETIATVDASGVVTGVAAGEATITVTSVADNTKTADCIVTVTKADAEFELDGDSDSTPYGTPLELVYGVTEGYDGTITCTSSNDAIADVAIGAEAITFTPKAVGTAEFTISVPGTDNYNAAPDATFTLTVTAPEGSTEAPSAEETETFDFSKNGWGLPTSSKSLSGSYSKEGQTVTISGTGYYYGSKALLLGKSGAYITLPAFSKPVTQIDVVGVEGASSSVKQNIYVGSEAVSTETTGANGITNEYEIDSEYQDAGTIYTLKVTSAHNTQIESIVVHMYQAPTTTVTLNGDGYATYCSQYPLDFSVAEGYTAWQITGVSGTTITFKKITGSIKGGQGILLKGESNATVTLASADSENLLEDNMLVGSTAPTYITATSGDYTNFGLKGDAFIKANDGVLPANKAYLPIETSLIPSSSEARLSFVFNDDETTTGIADVRSKMSDGSYYDLQGRKVNGQLPKGLYIVNGKKMVVK